MQSSDGGRGLLTFDRELGELEELSNPPQWLLPVAVVFMVGLIYWLCCCRKRIRSRRSVFLSRFPIVWLSIKFSFFFTIAFSVNCFHFNIRSSRALSSFYYLNCEPFSIISYGSFIFLWIEINCVHYNNNTLWQRLRGRGSRSSNTCWQQVLDKLVHRHGRLHNFWHPARSYREGLGHNQL